MEKEKAMKVFDRLEEAGLNVGLRRKAAPIEVSSVESNVPDVEDDARYEVEVSVSSLRSAERIRTLADVVDGFEVRIVPEFSDLVIR